jgi:hypothetical protein
MSILNRRNALMGWAVWTVGKQVMKQKAKSAVTPEPGSRRNRAMLALGAVAAAAVTTLFFWRRHENGEDAGEPMG